MKKAGFISIFDNSKLYMFEDGKLQNMKIEEISFHRRDDGIFLGVMKLKTPNGNIVVRNEDPEKGWPIAFESVEDFEEPNSLRPLDIHIDEIHFGNIHGAVVKDGYIDYWSIRNGEPVKSHELITDFYCTPGEKCRLAPGLEPPSASYRTRKELLSWSEYISKDENGKETKHIGVNKLAMLDDDQVDLVKRLIKTLNDMKDNDIELTTDCCDNLMAFNTRHFEDFDYTYSGRIDRWTRPGKHIDREADAFKIGTIDTYGDDIELLALLKED